MLKNLFLGLQTYADMSPDLGLRRQIVRAWQARPDRSLEVWYDLFGQSAASALAKEVAAFVYLQMAIYSGLPFAKVLPSDRLEADLHLSLVCWFDWQTTFCDDFASQFGVDISLYFDLDALNTVEDLVVFLDQQLATVNYSAAER
jgi:hypothetical protein